MLLSLASATALAEGRAETPPDIALAEEWVEIPSDVAPTEDQVDDSPIAADPVEEDVPEVAETSSQAEELDSAENQVLPMSLLPLEEVTLSLDLEDAGIFRNELDAVPVAALLSLRNNDYYGHGEKIVAEDGDVILWAKADGYVDNDEIPDTFIQVGLDGTIDLTPTTDNYNNLTLHLIVGKPDQLLTTNTRYKVNLQLPSDDQDGILSLEGYFLPTEDEEGAARTPVDATYSGSYQSWRYDETEMVDYYYTYFVVRNSQMKKENDIAVKLTLNAPYDTLTPKVYYGFFSTQEELDAAIAKAANSNSSQLQPGTDITDQLFPDGSIEAEGGFTLYAENNWTDEVTVVLTRGDKLIWSSPVRLTLSRLGDYISLSSNAYDPENPGVSVGRNTTTESWMENGRYYYFDVYRMNERTADRECLIRATYEHEDDYNADYSLYVEKVVASTEKFYDDFESVEGLPDIKEDFFGTGYKADYSKGVYFSIFGKGEGHPLLDTAAVKVYGPTMSVGTGSIYSENNTVAKYNSDLSVGKTRVFTMADEATPATGKYTYRTKVYFSGNSATSGSDLKLSTYVEKAVAGTQYYNSLADAKSQTDIQDKLLYISSPEEVAGYEADFSKGVHFTIFWYDGSITKFIIQTAPYVAPTYVPPEASRDTYFYVNGAQKLYSASGESKTNLNAWAMPGTVDGYYFGYAEDSTNYGVQTVLLLDQGNAVEDGTVIYPTFYSGNGVTVYAGHPEEGSPTDGETESGNEAGESGKQGSGEKQISGESPVTFHSGKAIQYSAAAEDNSLAKNYWVTFVTRQTGAKLYANAHIDELKDKDEPNNPVRRVQLDGAHNFYHDIFFANIGDEALEGLSVELDATNVELDPYWTVGETKTLAPFTTTSEGYYDQIGMLPNVGKIRLLPKKNADGSMVTGDIEGTITIKSANGGELTFDLTGKAQEAQIVTETLATGVRYVPYNSMIQTDVMGAADAVTFSYTGKMPDGITLFPNGKLYGVPTGQAGDYTFTVTATYQAPGEVGIVTTNSKEFTLTVLDNTAENVDAATDKGYELLDRVDDTVTGTAEQVFRSNGDLSQFMYFYLDGVKLTKNKDFTLEEGSTRIVIQPQALKNRGSGTHTLAAEFRTNSLDTNTVKRAAQNYAIPASSSGNRAPSHSGTASNPPEVQKEPTVQITFQDVMNNAWYYNEVMWAAKNGYMIGVSDKIFAPNGLISQPMVTTILARMAKATLPSDNTDVANTGVEPGQWYTNAAVWAWRSGIVGDSTFSAQPPLSRGDLATTLVRYLNYLGVSYTAPAEAPVFGDTAEMTEEQLVAFQRLYQIGVLKGVGGNLMAPQRSTTRAEMATIVQRLDAYLADK